MATKKTKNTTKKVAESPQNDTETVQEEVSQVGKKIWELAPSPLGGRPRLFTSPLTLWRKFLAYCKWVDENPWEDKSGSNSLTTNTKASTNAMKQQVRMIQRAYTLYGFCTYSGIYKCSSFKQKYYGKETLCQDPKEREKHEGFSTVIDAIEATIASQQIDGALLNVFNGNLVARLNGLAENVKSEVNGEVALDYSKLPKFSKEDLKELEEINARLK